MSECLLWMGLPLDGRGNEDQEYLDGWVAPGIGSHGRAGLVMLEWGDAWIGCFTPAACAARRSRVADAWMGMLGWRCLDGDAWMRMRPRAMERTPLLAAAVMRVRAVVSRSNRQLPRLECAGRLTRGRRP
jgi:hypothetical protein